MHRYAASFALATALLPAIVSPASAATPSPEFQQRVLAVVEFPGDRYSSRIRDVLSAERRFVILPSAADAKQTPAKLVAAVAEAARKGGFAAAPTYALVPRFSLGAMHTSIPSEVRGSDGKVIRSGSDEAVTVAATLTCPFEYTADLYEVPSGRLVRAFHLQEELTRKIEYTYTRRDSAGSIAVKAVELGASLAIEMARPPALAFATQANSAINAFAWSMASQLREMSEFQLQAGVTGWASDRDRVFFNLGAGLNVRPDDWYRVLQDGRQVGVLKVRTSNDKQSEAQPIFMDATLKVGDRVVEYPKANVWHGLKAGGLALTTGPLVSAGYGLQWDVAPTFGGSETYFTTDLEALSDGKSPGFQGQLGLIKKTFIRRWGFSLGLKAGVVNVPAVTLASFVPCATLATGVDCFITPDLVWTNDLGLEALWPISTLAAPNVSTYPLGPTLRTGLTWVF